jgi:hypothetical protein
MGNNIANHDFEAGMLVYWNPYTSGGSDDVDVSITDYYSSDGNYGVSCRVDGGGDIYAGIKQPVQLVSGIPAFVAIDYKVTDIGLGAGGSGIYGCRVEIVVGGVVQEAQEITSTTGWKSIATLVDLTGDYEVEFRVYGWAYDDLMYATVIFDQANTPVDSSNSYTISSLSDLEDMANDLYGTYTLTQDVDASGTQASDYNSDKGWLPIGSMDFPFMGTLDGNGYKITGLECHRDTEDFCGLFGATAENSVIKNLTFESPSIKGNSYVSCVVGHCYATDFDYVYVDGGSLQGTENVGGLCGGYYNGDIDECELSISVSELDTSAGSCFGGLIGLSLGGTFDQVIFDGTEVNAPNKNTVGGLIGWSDTVGEVLFSTINKGYIKTDVTGNNQVGGLIGYGTITHLYECMFEGNVTGYDSVGGLYGFIHYGDIDNCAALNGNVTGSNGSTGGEGAGGIIGQGRLGGFNKVYSNMEVNGDLEYHALLGILLDGDEQTDVYVDSDYCSAPLRSAASG